MGLGVVGLEPDRRVNAEFGDRLLRLPLVSQGGAEVGVGLGVGRLLPPPIPEPEAPHEGRADGRDCRSQRPLAARRPGDDGLTGGIPVLSP